MTSNILSEIRRLEVELVSSCNRECPWCINSVKSRRPDRLGNEVLIELLRDIKDNGFIAGGKPKRITLNGYSEPFLNRNLSEQVGIIKKELGYIKLGINTNGDFLSLDALENLDVNSIAIMDYDNRGVKYWKEKLSQLNCPVISISNKTILATRKNIHYVKVKLNWTKYARLENRGGFFKEDRIIENGLYTLNFKNDLVHRDYPCYQPRGYPSIEADGSVMPCCETRSDTHPDFLMGNIRDKSFTDIYTSEKYQNLVGIMESKEYDNYPSYCKYCHKSRKRSTYGK